MKRITKIELENYRAYFGKYAIDLPKGQNLLIYGENGSGKSSFFKALNNYLESSRDDAFEFIKNRYSTEPSGNINITFQDCDETHQITVGTEQTLSFGSQASTHSVQFVQNAELIKGFLDYRSLLDVYANKEPNPNLFELIVLNILGNHFNTASTYRFAEKWKSLQYNLIKNSYTRRDWTHQSSLNKLPIYEAALREVLNRVLDVLNNELLETYFPDLNIKLEFELQPLNFNYGWKDNWFTTADLRLKVIQNGETVQEDYSDFLNEARLSALAICIYLASLKVNPEAIEYKILFLDDIFVGLDTSNRMPILEILKNEFSDYQIFIATYDRHLFELAKREFEGEAPEKWESIELYVGKDEIDSQPYDKPIMVKGESNFEKGTCYLHDRIKPDYPASANYFRKTLEEIIQEFIPYWETADSEDSNQIPRYKLGALIYRAKRFLEKTGNNCTTVQQIIGLLPTLLHPLSHHDISSPIYKGELVRVEKLIPQWIQELKELEIDSNYKCSSLEGRNLIRVKFVIDSTTGHHSIYELRTIEPICLKLETDETKTLSKVRCFAEKCWGENNGGKVERSQKTFSKEERENGDINFLSLEDAYNKLHAKNILVPAIGNFPKIENYMDALEYLDQNGNFQALTSILNE